MTVVNFLIQFSVCYIQPVYQIRFIVQSIFLSFWKSVLCHVTLNTSNVFFRSARLWLIQIVLKCLFLVGRHCSSISIILCSKLLVDFYRNKLLIFWWAWWSWIMWSNLNITLHCLTIQLTNFSFVHLYGTYFLWICILAALFIQSIGLINVEILSRIIIM